MLGKGKITGAGTGDSSQQPCIPFGGTGTIHVGASVLVFGWLSYLLLRALKHRFGPTSELGLFEMVDAGLVGVPDAYLRVALALGVVKAADGTPVYAIEPSRRKKASAPSVWKR